MGTRSVEGINVPRKSLPGKSLVTPQFPPELVQRMPPSQVQHNFTNQNLIGNRETLVKFAVPMNNSARNDNGSITIVIDKSEICNCTPNDDVTIHVTTTPKITPKRQIKTLSEADLTNDCNANCSSCQRCTEFKKSANLRVFPIDPNLNLFRPSNNNLKEFNRLPRQQQSLPRIPLTNLPTISEGFTFSKNNSLSAKRNRSMDDFRTMRKMITPSGFEPKIGQLPMKASDDRQVGPQDYKESRLFPLVSLNNNQNQVLLRRTTEPDLGQTKINRSFQIPFLRNNVVPRQIPQQQPIAMRKENFVQREKQFTRPRQQNTVPLPTRSNLNGKESIPTVNGGGKNKINELPPQQGQQSQIPVNRVLRPPTLNLNNRFWSKRDVVSAPNITTAPVRNQKQTFGNLLRKRSTPPPNIFEVGRQPKFNTLIQAQHKNRFPEKRRSNSRGISLFNEVNLRPLIAQRPVMNFMSAKNYVPKTSVPNQLKNVRHNADQEPLFVRRQPSQSMPKKTNLLGLKSNTQIRNSQQLQVFALKKRTPVFQPQQMNKNPMNVVKNQPPRLVLKKRSVPRPAFNSYPQMKSRQQHNFRFQKNFTPQQTPHFASRQRSPTMPTYRKSLILVPQNKDISKRNLFAKPNFPQKQPFSRFTNIMLPARNRNSLIPVRKNDSKNLLQKNIVTQPRTNLRRKNPVVPFGIHSTQRKKSSQDKLAAPRQSKHTMLDSRGKRNEIQKTNQYKLQSSLPMNVMNPNQSVKDAVIPQSTQSVPISKTNVQFQNMPQLRSMSQMLLPPMKNFLTPPTLQKNCQIPQPPMVYYQKSVPRIKQRRDKFKGMLPKVSHMI